MMKTRTALVVSALALFASPALADSGSTNLGNGKSALRALEDPTLQTQRAGAVKARTSIGASERDSLRTVEAASTELAAMRAGDLNLSDRDITLIAIVVGIVLLIVIVA